MTRERVEALTQRLLDGELGPEERVELERLIDRDPEALRRYLRLCELEHLLWAALGPVDVRDATVRQIAEREARVEASVAAAVRGLPAPRARPRWRRTVAWALGGAAVAAAVLLVAGRRGAPPVTPPPVAVFATVTRAVDARAGGPDGRPRVVAAGDALTPPVALELGQHGSWAARLEDGATLALGPGARLHLEGDVRAAHRGDGSFTVERRFQLERGRLEAELPAQPAARRAVFATPHARATVLGTRFALTVDDAGTELEVREGLVLFQQLAGGAVREVAAGGSARAAAAAPLPPAPAAASPVASALSFEEAVQRWDFDQGVRPPELVHGELDPGPPRSQGGPCVVGTINPHAATTYTVGLYRRGGPLVTHTDRTVIEFDYWVGAGARRLKLQIESPRFGKNYGVTIPDIVTERWARASVRLADFRPYDPSLPRFEEGDELNALLIMGGRIGGLPLYVDNLVIGER